MKMINNIDNFFNDDPWLNIANGTYPNGRRLYKKDERFWVSINDDGQILFFIHDLGAENLKALINISSVNLKIEKAAGDAFRLICTLMNNDADMKAKFSIVAKDVAYHCSLFHGTQLFSNVQSRIKSWANFLKPSKIGLSYSEFVGFWGELYSISQIFMKVLAPADVVRFWIGPDNKKQDLTLNKLAFEIKTSMSGDPQTIKISSLDQLERVTESLYLMHIIASPSNNDQGYSLSMLYKKCLEYLAHDLSAESSFLRKCARIYGDASEEQLESRFSISTISLFDVRDGFPLISSKTIKYSCGIASAQYEIFTSSIKEFEVTKSIDEIIQNG